MKKRVLLSTLGLATILSVSLVVPAKADTLKDSAKSKHTNLSMASRWIYSGKITGSGVRLRSAPGTSSKVITLLSKNQRVTVLGFGDKKVNGHKWAKIRIRSGQVGYVSENYLAVFF